MLAPADEFWTFLLTMCILLRRRLQSICHALPSQMRKVYVVAGGVFFYSSQIAGRLESGAGVGYGQGLRYRTLSNLKFLGDGHR